MSARARKPARPAAPVAGKLDLSHVREILSGVRLLLEAANEILSLAEPTQERDALRQRLTDAAKR